MVGASVVGSADKTGRRDGSTLGDLLGAPVKEGEARVLGKSDGLGDALGRWDTTGR